MRHTLVAAFATLTDANRTRGDLMSRGIAREQIHAIGAESADIHAYDAPYTTTPDTPVDRTHHESKITHFFKSLFGHEPHETHRHYATAYPDAVRRGALVIAVDVDDEDQLAKARDALEYNGAIDINERGGSGTVEGYPGPSSPYAGATGGDSHFVRLGATLAQGRLVGVHVAAFMQDEGALRVAFRLFHGRLCSPDTRSGKAEHQAGRDGSQRRHGVALCMLGSARAA